MEHFAGCVVFGTTIPQMNVVLFLLGWDDDEITDANRDELPQDLGT